MVWKYTISTNWRPFIKLPIENVKSMNSLYGGLGYIFTDLSNKNLKITFLIGSVLRKINSHISCPLALSDLKVHICTYVSVTIYWQVSKLSICIGGGQRMDNSGWWRGWWRGRGKQQRQWQSAEVTWTQFGGLYQNILISSSSIFF